MRRLGDLDALRIELGKVEQGSRALEIGIGALAQWLLVRLHPPAAPRAELAAGPTGP